MIISDDPTRIPINVETVGDRLRIRQGVAEVSLTADELDALLDVADNRPRFGKLWRSNGR